MGPERCPVPVYRDTCTMVQALINCSRQRPRPAQAGPQLPPPYRQLWKTTDGCPTCAVGVSPAGRGRHRKQHYRSVPTSSPAYSR